MKHYSNEYYNADPKSAQKEIDYTKERYESESFSIQDLRSRAYQERIKREKQQRAEQAAIAADQWEQDTQRLAKQFAGIPIIKTK